MRLESLNRQARLASGVALLAFLACHLGNMTLGLVSLDALEAGRVAIMGLWRNPVGDALLAVAAATHVVCAGYTIANRRSPTLTTTDTIQMLLGALVVPLALGHILTTRMSPAVTGAEPVSYAVMLSIYWVYAPAFAIQQLTLVIVVWTHGAIGLHAWLSLKPWWPRFGVLVLLALFATPMLAVLGFVEAGKQVLALQAGDPAFAARITAALDRLRGMPGPIDAAREAVTASYFVAAGLVFLVFALRLWVVRRAPVPIAYDGGLAAEGRRGLSILEISRLGHVPHASVCSGRGRCGTCRVRVVEGGANLSPRDDIERRTLRDAPAEVRLACRARTLGGPVVVERLLPPDADATAVHDPQAWMGLQAPAAVPVPGGAS